MTEEDGTTDARHTRVKNMSNKAYALVLSTLALVGATTKGSISRVEHAATYVWLAPLRRISGVMGVMTGSVIGMTKAQTPETKAQTPVVQVSEQMSKGTPDHPDTALFGWLKALVTGWQDVLGPSASGYRTNEIYTNGHVTVLMGSIKIGATPGLNRKGRDALLAEIQARCWLAKVRQNLRSGRWVDAFRQVTRFSAMCKAVEGYAAGDHWHGYVDDITFGEDWFDADAVKAEFAGASLGTWLDSLTYPGAASIGLGDSQVEADFDALDAEMDDLFGTAAPASD